MRFRITLAVATLLMAGAVAIESAAFRLGQNNDSKQNRHSSISDAKQTDALRLRVITNQLAVENGKIPVELKCEDAELSTPSVLVKLSCILINKTYKPIQAGALYTSINIEKERLISVSSNYTTFDTFLHQDFREQHKNNLFRPGQEYPYDILPVSYDSDVVIKGVVVGIDYIEFDDGTSAGPNRAGSQMISDTREGASKYKKWLAQRYDQAGQSLDAVIPLLDANQPLPEELRFQTSPEESGARMYRNFARRTFKKEGAAGLLRQLKNTKPSLYQQD